jgi:small subunit ribosomal protein S21
VNGPNDRKDGLCVVIRAGDDIESAIKKFTRKVRNSGLMQELASREHYVKPSVKKKMKHRAAISEQRRASRR